MMLNKDNPSPSTFNSPSPSSSYSPLPFTTHLYFLLFSPPVRHLPPFHFNSNLNINNNNNYYNKTNSTLLPVLYAYNTVVSSPWALLETMRRRPRATFLLFFLAIIVFAVFSLHVSRNALSNWRLDSDLDHHHHTNLNNHRIVLRNRQNIVDEFPHPARRVSSIKNSISTVSVLLPDWEILVIVSPNMPLSPPPDSGDQYHCLFRNNDKSPAKFSGVLPFTNRTTFKCALPESARRRRMFSQPTLVTRSSENKPPEPSPAPELLRWNFFVYESFSTDDDVVLFAKGVNSRQGLDRSPNELCCFFGFGDGIRNAVRTAVTSSVQEVFRCPHPDPSQLGLGSDYRSYQGQGSKKIGVSLEIVGENLVFPSVAYYMPRPNPKPNSNSNAVAVQAQSKHLLCACTMVYNVAKFLREWVMYHSKVGVENFLLYDNGSDDDLEGVIKELRGEGYNITALFWIWPKTQEAGFSHSVLYSKSKGMCSWIMYVDVDEFVFSPSWGVGNENGKGPHYNDHGRKQVFPSLKSMLPEEHGSAQGRSKIGQVSVQCLEFGPSGRKQHPVEGVTQGYTCRRRVEQRHKSMVLVDAVDPSLWNVIHHFKVNVKEGFASVQIGLEDGVVNHYKYQAWEEFKSKFRRRVSAYVVDWRQAVNPNSKDRTPGLGFEPIEPEDWAYKFCEVRDHRLKSLTREWFGTFTPHHGHKMAWQTS